MYVLGITPIDTQITAFGLHLISTSVEVLFIKTKLGYVLMAISLMIFGLRKLLIGKFHAAIITILITIVVTSFFIRVTSTTLSYQSFQERAGYVPVNKFTINSSLSMPVIFAYIDSMFNQLVGAIIVLLDSTVHEVIRFFPDPFNQEQKGLLSSLHILSLKENRPLRREIDNLMNDELLEAYQINPKEEAMYTNELKGSFSRKGQNTLKSLEEKIDLQFQHDHSYQYIAQLLSYLMPDNTQIDEQIRGEILLYDRHRSKGKLNNITLTFFTCWPAVIGFLNALMWAIFLPIVLIVILTHQGVYLLTWFAGLILIKFSWLIAYLAHLSAIVILKYQLTQSGVSGYFYQPYFAYASAFLIYVGVLLLFMMGFSFSKGLLQSK